MPDLIRIPTWTCASNIEWSAKIQSSSDRFTFYNVTWGRMYSGPTMYGWKCDCPAFMYRRKTCKHIELAKEMRCGWNSELEPTNQAHLDRTTGKHHCPECGDLAESVEVAV